MLAKGYHIERLKPEVEENIGKTLREGSNSVIKILHEHFNDFVPEDSEKFFEKVLIQIATTVSKVASLPELHFDQKAKKRIAFLPGFTTKDKKRVTHNVKFDKKFIPSDIAFNITGNEKIEGVKETHTNQALLYYYLLEHHKDDKTFLNGGTHQFLINNATSLKTKSKYHLDLLQVFTGKKNSKKEDEITFLTIEVDFKKQNSVEKLYLNFDKILNDGNPEFRWPLNIKDKKESHSKNDSTYKMRGYLVSLWYKILHDPSRNNIETWFFDCIILAENSGFQKLKERLQKLQKVINFNTGEHYNFWYSLVFNPLPNFASPTLHLKETLGSAMLMTNFELKPQFFFWVQPWINRMYRHLRDFENLKIEISKTREQLKNIYAGNGIYLPKAVQGERLTSSSTDYEHKLPLIYYYQLLFGTDNDEKNKIEIVATNILDSINKLHLIQRVYKIRNADIKDKSIFNVINIDSFKDVIPDSELIIRGYEKNIIQNLPGRKYAFNSMLTELTDEKNLTRFFFRMVGRLVTLALYCKCNYTLSQINLILSKRKFININPELVSSENNFRILRINFFIEELGGGDEYHSRRDISIRIQKHLSDFEKNFLATWYNDFHNKILSEKIITTHKEIELKAILEAEYKYRH